MPQARKKRLHYLLPASVVTMMWLDYCKGGSNSSFKNLEVSSTLKIASGSPDTLVLSEQFYLVASNRSNDRLRGAPLLRTAINGREDSIQLPLDVRTGEKATTDSLLSSVQKETKKYKKNCIL